MPQRSVSTTSTGAAPGARRRGRPPRASLDEIVSAATRLFGQRGVKGTSIAAIAEEVGLSDAGVLHHFPSKSALLDAVLERELDVQAARAREFAEPGGLEAIRRFAAWGRVNQETPELVALQIAISAEGAQDSSELRDYVLRRYAGVQQLVVDLIRQGIDRGEIRADADAEWEASALVAFLDGIRLQWRYSDGTMSLDHSVRRYFDLLVTRLVASPGSGGAPRAASSHERSG